MCIDVINPIKFAGSNNKFLNLNLASFAQPSSYTNILCNIMTLNLFLKDADKLKLFGIIKIAMI